MLSCSWDVIYDAQNVEVHLAYIEYFFLIVCILWLESKSDLCIIKIEHEVPYWYLIRLDPHLFLLVQFFEPKRTLYFLILILRPRLHVIFTIVFMSGVAKPNSYYSLFKNQISSIMLRINLFAILYILADYVKR